MFSAEQEEVLRGWRYGDRQEPLSARELLLALARLGGHENPKWDGLPGWLTLWRGWQKLQLMVQGARIAARAAAARAPARDGPTEAPDTS